LRSVSKAAGMSHAHFQRTFKALTGETLATYIRSRRMANALDQLLRTDQRVLDIAIDAGFESQEAFARAFKRAFGMTPTEYRRIGDKHRFLKKLRLDESYLQHMTSMQREPELCERDAMRVVGFRTHFYGVESEKNNLGDVLPQLWAQYLPRADETPYPVPGDYFGVVSQDEHDPEQLVYHACRAVERETELPDGMASMVVPAATWAIFEHRGEAQNIDQTVNYIYSTWLATSPWRHTFGPDLEIYGDRWHETSPESVMHYAIPVQSA
ncbi:MAG: GyrI-like domain-containing protein, partial [Pseudomonadota bacterium]